MGSWLIAKDRAGARLCEIRLRLTSVPGGYELRVPMNCRTIVANGISLSTWSVDGAGGLAFATAARHVVYRFTRRAGRGLTWTLSSLRGEGPDGPYTLFRGKITK